MTDLQNTINKAGTFSSKARAIGMAAALIIGGPWLISNSVEMLDSTEIMVIQYPNGTLLAAIEPGWYGQWFGSVTKYPLRSQFSFSSAFDQGEAKNESLKLRFNDGGHANVSGVVSWEMPVDHDHLIMIHRKFGNTKSVEQQIIRPTLESAAYTSGPLMSSTESAAEKRNLLLQYMQDQAKNGTYQTRTVSLKVPDPLTGVEKTVNAAEIVMAGGIPVREQESSTKVFGINLLPMTINQIKYDDAIESQITQRQVSIQGVQIAQANALKAEQDAITAEKLGQAEAAKAKWTQEAIKAQKITEAQQFLEVAMLEAKQAEQYKNKQILEGQGNAEKKRLEMQANGALDQKLDAYVSIQKAYAQAIGAYKGAWVPQIVTGGAGGTAGSGAQQMIDLLSVKAAKDLGINMSIEGAAQTTGKQ
ncbi:MAG: SPFH domain-containing protein [Methylobacter sp.]